MSKFRINAQGFHDFMTSEEIIGTEMRRRAAAVRQRAIEISPVSRGFEKKGRRHYRDSFAPVTTSVGRADFTPWGPQGRRIYATVANTSRQARFVEFGSSAHGPFNATPRYRVLGRALEAAGDQIGRLRGVGRYTSDAPKRRRRPVRSRS